MSDRPYIETLTFEENAVIQEVVGSQGEYIDYIASRLDIVIAHRGNALSLEGRKKSVLTAKSALKHMYAHAKKGTPLQKGDIDVALKLDQKEFKTLSDSTISIKTRKGPLHPRSPVQAKYIEALQTRDMVFGIGPAGTGKTFLAVAVGVAALNAGDVQKIILSRPAVEAGERLGFLPGDLKDKVDPYLRPIYDALADMLPPEKMARFLADGTIEVAPLAFMRGRTLSNAYIILDEAQNTTPMQIKMFMTRLGENSKMVITGDTSQIDLPPNQPSGLIDALHKLENIKGIEMVRLSAKDIVRHPLVEKIVSAYEK